MVWNPAHWPGILLSIHGWPDPSSMQSVRLDRSYVMRNPCWFVAGTLCVSTVEWSSWAPIDAPIGSCCIWSRINLCCMPFWVYHIALVVQQKPTLAFLILYLRSQPFVPCFPSSGTQCHGTEVPEPWRCAHMYFPLGMCSAMVLT